MSENRRSKGSFGEDKACDYLTGLGYKFLTRNFHYSRYAEIDLVFQYKDEIVFVEVKTDYTGQFGEAAAWINQRKIKNIILASKGFLRKIDNFDAPCRFDAIIVHVTNNTFTIEHIENAFYA
ncbi:MAG: YraN family protein [Candidatus Delongbacteria bacterium]|nr:YraN family protein [Candidatus Delongbacteria bacterium]MBN2836961.1 YraN family protein [Candidatus Delongbacteria bacterium]